MKTRRMLSHNELLQQLFQQLKFPATVIIIIIIITIIIIIFKGARRKEETRKPYRKRLYIKRGE
jgi:hypothetical protein